MLATKSLTTLLKLKKIDLCWLRYIIKLDAYVAKYTECKICNYASVRISKCNYAKYAKYTRWRKNYLIEIFDHGCLHGSLLYNSSLWQERVVVSWTVASQMIPQLFPAILRSCTEGIHASTYDQKFQKGSFFWDTLAVVLYSKNAV